MPYVHARGGPDNSTYMDRGIARPSAACRYSTSGPARDAINWTCTPRPELELRCMWGTSGIAPGGGLWFCKGATPLHLDTCYMIDVGMQGQDLLVMPQASVIQGKPTVVLVSSSISFTVLVEKATDSTPSIPWLSHLFWHLQ